MHLCLCLSLTDCSRQDERFSLVFTIASFLNNFMSLVNGYLFDRFGTMVTRLLGMWVHVYTAYLSLVSTYCLVKYMEIIHCQPKTVDWHKCMRHYFALQIVSGDWTKSTSLVLMLFLPCSVRIQGANKGPEIKAGSVWQRNRDYKADPTSSGHRPWLSINLNLN